ncbi:thymidine kinase [Cellulomonas sp. PhB143]|uniref:thymidine kinase n=1 Tax=Cellulomonas sp. PhB143 TaxID=2485186 RepID=UPI000F48046F
MFAGKSEELLRRVRRLQVAGRAVDVVTHALDTRRGVGAVTSHAGARLDARTVASASALAAGVPDDVGAVAVDEAQFFGPGLVDAVEGLADRGLVVIVAGLDVTYDARPFEPMVSLAALAERVDRLTAVCAVCGRDAPFHVRADAPPSAGGGADALAPVAEHVGGSETYEARCRDHLGDAPWRQGRRSGTNV